MTRPMVLLAIALLASCALVVTLGTLSADSVEEQISELPLILLQNGSEWAPLGRHAISVTGAGAAASGTATATFKSKLGGPKTYVVLAGSTSDVLLSDPKPRFRVATDREGAFSIQLAQFEPDDSLRTTAIERVRRGIHFTKKVDLEMIEIGENLWELRPAKSLQPGEYALVTSESEPVADFTIAAKGY